MSVLDNERVIGQGETATGNSVTSTKIAKNSCDSLRPALQKLWEKWLKATGKKGLKLHRIKLISSKVSHP